jgi:hypothetical protein
MLITGIPHDAENDSSQMLNMQQASALLLQVSTRELIELMTASHITEEGGEI